MKSTDETDCVCVHMNVSCKKSQNVWFYGIRLWSIVCYQTWTLYMRSAQAGFFSMLDTAPNIHSHFRWMEKLLACEFVKRNLIGKSL